MIRETGYDIWELSVMCTQFFYKSKTIIILKKFFCLKKKISLPYLHAGLESGPALKQWRTAPESALFLGFHHYRK